MPFYPRIKRWKMNYMNSVCPGNIYIVSSEVCTNWPLLGTKWLGPGSGSTSYTRQARGATSQGTKQSGGWYSVRLHYPVAQSPPRHFSEVAKLAEKTTIMLRVESTSWQLWKKLKGKLSLVVMHVLGYRVHVQLSKMYWLRRTGYSAFSS